MVFFIQILMTFATFIIWILLFPHSLLAVNWLTSFLQKYEIEWKLLEGLHSSEQVIGYRIDYKEYGVEGLLGSKKVQINNNKVLIVGMLVFKSTPDNRSQQYSHMNFKGFRISIHNSSQPS